MKNLNKYFLTLVLIFSFEIVSQESSDGEPTTIQGLLQLVEQGRTSEQNVNTQREAEFLANKNQQAAKLAAEKRELARQERIADQLEAEYKKNDAILVVKEAAYKKELGSLVECFLESLLWQRDSEGKPISNLGFGALSGQCSCIGFVVES